MKAAGVVALLASIALYLAQIFFYTKDQELLVYGAFGVLWFAALSMNTFGRTSLIGMAVVSGLAAFGLGFVPHRLRLGGGFDIYVVLFPVAHFIATLAYLWARRKSSQ